MDKRERHFVLVCGACHGAWCWYKVATLLRLAGQRITAIDLAASGVHPKRVEEVHSISDQMEPLMEFMEALPADERVVLVGHSAGGISISLAMERFPANISVAVYVAAFMYGPDLKFLTVTKENSVVLENICSQQNLSPKSLTTSTEDLLIGLPNTKERKVTTGVKDFD